MMTLYFQYDVKIRFCVRQSLSFAKTSPAGKWVNRQL